MWGQALPRPRNLVALMWSQDASGSGNQAAQVWGQAVPFLGFRLRLCVMLMLLDPEISLLLCRIRPLLSLAIGLCVGPGPFKVQKSDYTCMRPGHSYAMQSVGTRPLLGPTISLYQGPPDKCLGEKVSSSNVCLCSVSRYNTL